MIRYTHTNLIAKDWRKLARFYQEVFSCEPLLPERDLSGEWLERATDLPAARLKGMHLRLPGHGDQGPTLEIFEYEQMPTKPDIKPNTPGFSHIAFAVDDVAAMAQKVFAAGGQAVGELTQVDVDGVGSLVFQYVTDPDGNIIELQSWSK